MAVIAPGGWRGGAMQRPTLRAADLWIGLLKWMCVLPACLLACINIPDCSELYECARRHLCLLTALAWPSTEHENTSRMKPPAAVCTLANAFLGRLQMLRPAVLYAHAKNGHMPRMMRQENRLSS